MVDLAGMDMTSASIPVLYDHMDYLDCIVGQVDSLRVEGGQLLAEGPFILSTEPSVRIADLAAKGYSFQASIGADIKEKELIAAGNTVAVNGREYAGPVYLAKKTVLREISFVVLGADSKTSAIVARRQHKLKGAAMPSFEEWLSQMSALFGVDSSTLDEAQKAGAQLAYQTYVGESESAEASDTEEEDDMEAADDEEEDKPASTEPPAAMPAAAAADQTKWIKAQRAEGARQEAIRAACPSTAEHWVRLTKGGDLVKVSLAAHAIAKGWTVDQVKEVLENQRKVAEVAAQGKQAGPWLVSRSHEKDCTLQALQGALLLRSGIQLDSKVFSKAHPGVIRNVPAWLRAGINDDNRQQFMEFAHQYSDMSLVDLARESMRIAGKNAPHNRLDMIQAAFSGGTLTNIFTTNINTILVATYLEGPDTTEAWTRTVDVNDFKTNERPRMTKGAGLKLLPAGGEADHVSRSDVGESYRIHRYSAQWQIDEQDVIDDTYNALGDSPVEFGLAANRVRPDLTYYHLMSNPTLAATARALFNATDGNYQSTGYALSAANLKTARKNMFLVQENSVNLNLEATHIIVPPSLGYTARELMNSTTIVLAGTAGSVTERGSANVLQGLLQIVEEARLENGVRDPKTETASTTHSASTWFLASTRIPTIEVAYLRGTGRSPTVRSQLLTLGKYGIQYDVMLDIGVKAMDWRGLAQYRA